MSIGRPNMGSVMNMLPNSNKGIAPSDEFLFNNRKQIINKLGGINWMGMYYYWYDFLFNNFQLTLKIDSDEPNETYLPLGRPWLIIWKSK